MLKNDLDKMHMNSWINSIMDLFFSFSGKTRTKEERSQ